MDVSTWGRMRVSTDASTSDNMDYPGGTAPLSSAPMVPRFSTNRVRTSVERRQSCTASAAISSSRTDMAMNPRFDSNAANGFFRS